MKMKIKARRGKKSTTVRVRLCADNEKKKRVGGI